MSTLSEIREAWETEATALNARFGAAAGGMTLIQALRTSRRVKGRARRVANRHILREQVLVRTDSGVLLDIATCGG